MLFGDRRRRCSLSAMAILTIGIITSVVMTGRVVGQERDLYLDLARQAFEEGLESIPAQVERWKETWEPQPEWGYQPPGGPPYFARLAGSLYHVTGEERYAETAIEWMVRHHEYKEYFPEEMHGVRPDYAGGVPTLTDFFQMSFFGEAYLFVKDSPSLTAEQRQIIQQSIAEGAAYVFYFPEWGPMNRAMLRAYSLLLAAKAVPDHPDAAKWDKMARVLAADSWGKWEEEDAQIYHPVWLISLVRYVDALGDQSLFDHPTFRYYFDYFTHLLDPTGMIPDFGDARWHANWSWYVALLERAATQYDRDDYRWAARRIFNAMHAAMGATVGIGNGMNLLDAYRWSDERTATDAPPAVSEEVMEDLVGKKIVFRDGWDDNANYLLLNYRDEGPYARMARDYLRNTIPVEEEKMHHGHSDENSIVLMMSDGSVLLNDAGYRPRMPSGPWGEFRADYYHNRLVYRTTKRGRDQGLWEFLRNSGAYRPVETDKIEFWTADDFDVSRTRLTDARDGVQHDRVITWLKQHNVYVVFDIVKFLETDFYTLATLWHATTVLDAGDAHFVTGVDVIRGNEMPRNKALRIEFPERGIRTQGTFELERNLEPATAVYQTLASHYFAGHVETFVTVLAPVDRVAPYESPVDGIQVLNPPESSAGIGVALQIAGEEIFVCSNTDLLREIIAANKRPRYTLESGRVTYGPFSTDASFLYARRNEQSLKWAAMHMVGVSYEDRELFAAPWNTFTLEPDDWATGLGAGKYRFWEGMIDLP
ncbi:MAG: hypothetical protein JSW51_06390 [Gemmatimonadota bacterium]|nr:MAG: hypothetical protein JSW51_06390 [Gemmatimonadota bacterium]